MTAFATAATNQFQTILQSIAGLENKTFIVNNQDQLSARIGQGKLPAAGILYEGMRSTSTDQKGIACDLVCSVLILAESPKLLPINVTLDQNPASLLLLDACRRAILGQRSPMNHYWEFTLEAPVAIVKDQVVWLQRWTTKVMVSTRV